MKKITILFFTIVFSLSCFVPIGSIDAATLKPSDYKLNPKYTYYYLNSTKTLFQYKYKGVKKGKNSTTYSWNFYPGGKKISDGFDYQLPSTAGIIVSTNKLSSYGYFSTIELKSPIKKGHEWVQSGQMGPDIKYEIINTKATVKTKAGKYKNALVVKVIFVGTNVGTEYNYYVKGRGLVKTTRKKDGKTTVDTELYKLKKR